MFRTRLAFLFCILCLFAFITHANASTATFLPLDTTTQGSWTGVYGTDGFVIANDSSSSPPSYAAVTPANAATYTWANPSTDPRALYVSSTSTTRIASAYYTGASMSFGITLNDGKAHQVALYLLDLETNTRAETISITDASTNAVLDTRSFTGFNSGEYAIWTIQGNVNIQVTFTGGLNAVVSGFFFDPAKGSSGGSTPPPVVSITSPTTSATVSGTTTVTANATSSASIASVQFVLDGSNLGSPVTTGTSGNYSIQWNTTTATSGSHVLKAIATDSLGQSTTSATVSVTVSNGPSSGPSATFVKLDTATLGNWPGTYGEDGYIIPGDATVPPSYASVNIAASAVPYTWLASTTDPRGVLTGPTSSARIASAYYTSSSMTFDVNLTDGNVHQVALYCLDFDTTARAETVSILNASTNAVLATQAVSNFHGGEYLVFTLQGHVVIQVTYTSGQNAVLSGIFFGQSAPPAAPPTVSLSAPSAGNVSGSVTLTASASSTIGIASVQFQLDGANLGSPVTTSPYSASWNTITVNNGPHTLTAIATDTKGQQTTSASVQVTVVNSGAPPIVSITSPTGGTVSGTVTVTATASSPSLSITSVQFQLDGSNLGSPVTASPYSTSWNTTTASNAAHTLTAIATDTAGQQTTSTAVDVTVSNIGPPAPAATFVKLDTATSGNWVGVYGQDGFIIPNDATTPPSYAAFNTSAPTYTWLATTTDPRGLYINSSSNTRTETTYYTSGTMTFNVNLTDGNVHQVALYLLDLDTTARAETITILNATTNAVLSTEPMSNFHNGVYAVWNLQGNVIIQVTYTAGLNAVLSGIFFSTPSPGVPAPQVSISAPSAAASLSGTVSVTANATSSIGIASVQFQLDGANLGPAVTTAPYATSWNTLSSKNGSHTLTAIATDTQGQKTTSAGVQVTVANTGAPPTVSITSPTGGTVSGNITLTATASSPTLAIASVQFQVDGSNLGSPITAAPYSTSWNTTSVSNGSHNLTAIATDTAGQQTTSAIVNVAVANVGPPAPAATFVDLDSTTSGNWVGVYGQDGYIIPNDASVPPSYATVNIASSAAPYTWLATTTDPRGLYINPTSTTRTETTWYTGGTMTFDVNLTDGNVHEVALYLLDLDTTARAETISILNATTNAVLSTQAMSNFHNGVYAVWKLQGHVVIQVSYTAGLNAVLSGIFFSTPAPTIAPPQISISAPSAAATVSGTVTVTANATSAAGIASVQFQLDGANLGSAVTSSPYSTSWNTIATSNGAHTLTAIATDTLGQKTTSASVQLTVSNSGAPPSVGITAPANNATVSNTVTLTATASSPTLAIASVQFQLDGSNIGGAVTGSGPYSISWNTIGVANGSHTLTAVATDTVGQQATASISVTVANTGPAAPAATFVKFDSTTIGNWPGVYGQDGYIIPNDATLPPSYATVVTSATTYTWYASTTDPRALLVSPTSTNRIASAFVTSNTMTFDVNLTDNQLHQVALYCLDDDTTTRTETISILDANTQNVLSTQAVANFNPGLWAVWNLQGHVIIQVTFTGGVNAVVSGLFFRSLASLPLPTVNMVSPTAGTVSGPVTLSVTASSPQGISQVQFLVDNAPYGAPIPTTSNGIYTYGWASPTVANGTHTLSAIATDNLGLTNTATPVTVTVSNGPPPTPAATFLEADTTTSGSWVGVYGSDGFIIANDITDPPFYATFNDNGAQTFTFHAADPTTNIPGLEMSYTSDPATERIGSAFFQPYCTSGCANPPLLFDINFVDDQVHTLAVYFVDWHHNVRTETITVVNPTTQAVLDTRTITAFDQGIYLVWNIQGHVQIQVTLTGYLSDAVPDSVEASGFFFGAVTPPAAAPTVSLTAPAANSTVSGTVSVTANASSTVGLATVQFQLDGSNLGSVITAPGPYTISWNTTSALNGSHSLTAIATDTLGNTTTSLAVPVTVNNVGPPPVVSITAPAADASVSGSTTVTANATSADFTIASVQFLLDGSNLGSAVTGAGPVYSTSWSTSGVSNGSHTLSAIATDSQGQTTTSAGVSVTVANTGPPPPAASFVNLDTATSGNWVGVYGQDGYIIPNDASVPPSYASVSMSSSAVPYTWLATTTDPVGLYINPTSTTRTATTWYTSTTMTFNVNLTDGNVHEVALYCLDFDTTARAETITILNATTNAVLATEPMSNFHNGVYAVFKLQGNVIIQITYTGGQNAVLNGIFFSTPAPTVPAPQVSITAPSASASLSGTVSVTANATSSIGIASVQFQLDGANLGSAVTTSPYTTSWNTVTASNGSHTLTAIATDTEGQKTTSAGIHVTVANSGAPPTVSITSPTGGTVSGNITITASASSPTLAIASVQFQVDGSNFGSPITTSPYSISWNTVSVSNGSHNLTAIATDTVGQQTTSAIVNVAVSNTGPPPPAATFVKLDTTTSGNWVGTYGQDGYIIPNDASVPPSYATVNVSSSAVPYTWLSPTTDPRGLYINPTSTTRTETTWYTSTTMTFGVNLTDGNLHQIALYCLDLDSSVRAETISILNASTNAVLATEPMSNFHNGVYALFNVQGNVIIQITYTGGMNAVLSGIFFATPAPTVPAPLVSITGPSAGSVSGTVSVTANATSSIGIASVQFQLDGANLGSAVTATPYTTSWNTIAATNGSHTLTAIATDADGQKTTSAGVQVTVDNTGLPPSITLTSPTAGNVTNTVTVTANATSPTLAIASVQFVLDGANLGSPITAPSSGSNYSTQWVTNGVSNGTHTLTAVATDTVGQQTTSAQVVVNVENTGPPPATAVMVNRDTTTSGNWVGTYGKDGYIIPNDAFSPPSYAVVNLINANPYTWSATTTDTRGLYLNPTSSTRTATAYYTNSSFSIDINLTDNLPHQIALYCLDLETTERVETISILDANTNNVINTQQMSNFHNGVYGVWNVQGHIIVQVTFNSGLNAVVSGIFFEPTTPPPALPTVGLSSPAAGTVQGLVSLSASASSTVGVASVQFQIDGVNLGSPIYAPGPYTAQWNTAAGTNGTHVVTAVATDNVGQTNASAGVTVTVANPPPVIAITTPTASSTVSATVPVTASASSSVGIATVQFQLDGTNLGAALPGPGTSFTVQWTTPSATDGPHTLTAIATDILGQVTTSAGVQVTVSNGAPPAVSITAPAGNATVNGTITVTASASSADGISSVQFKLDNANLGAAVTGAGPYTVQWATTATTNGAHVLTAVATDTLSRSTTSAGVQVTVSNAAPTVSVTSPAANATLSGTVTITASASSPIGLASVQFQLDGANLGSPVSGTGPTFSFQWNTTSAGNGNHTITAIAADTQGQKTTSGGVVVTVANGPAPSVTMTSPAAGNVSGTSVAIAANVTSTVGLSSVQFQIDGTNLGAAQTGSGPTFATTWNATTVANGSHTISAVAKDILGQTTTGSVTVTVNNAAPVVNISAPAANATVSGTSVTLSATATSTVGVASVQFQVDGTNVGSAQTASPYSITWNTATVKNGSHTVTAVATDTFGQTGTSTGVSVTVQNAAPSISITAPAANAEVSSTVTVSADATSATLTIASVQFQLDGANLGSPVTAGVSNVYSTSWNTTTATNATHTLTAIATDTAGQTTTSAQVLVTVANNSGTVTPAAIFIKTDTTTSGSWKGVYGADGEFIANDPAAALPSYAPGVTETGGTAYEWTDSPGDTSDPRALTWTGTAPASLPGTYGGSPPRNPSTYYTATNMTFDVNLTDGFAHLVAMYAVDFDTTNTRVETVTVTDANTNAVLDTRQLSSFSSGVYVVWNLQGHVHIQVTYVSGSVGNAVASALFFSSFTGTPAASVSITSPAQNAVLSGDATITVNATSSAGIASVQFQLDGVDLGTVTGPGPNYTFQWATPTASNGNHTLTAIAIDNVEQASTSVGIPIQISNGPPAAPAATFITMDTTTKGNWIGTYGSDGYIIPDFITNPPFYATVNLGSIQTFPFANPAATTDEDYASLLVEGTGNSIASDFYAATSFSFPVNLVDNQQHQLALYFQDYHGNARTQTITILDNNNNVLDTRNISTFEGGVYLVWNVQGSISVQVQATGTSGFSAILTGMFFSPVPTP